VRFLQCTNARVSISHELQGTYTNLFIPAQSMSVGSSVEARALLGDLPIGLLVKAPSATATQQQTAQAKNV
jgi:hypothetical protein